ATWRGDGIQSFRTQSVLSGHRISSQSGKQWTPVQIMEPFSRNDPSVNFTKSNGPTVRQYECRHISARIDIRDFLHSDRDIGAVKLKMIGRPYAYKYCKHDNGRISHPLSDFFQ